MKMSKTVDARGLACPQPVILTRNALQESDAVTTIVDNETAKSNVSRMAAKQGCQVDVEEREDGIYVHLTKGEEAAKETEALPLAAPASGPLVLTVPSDIMGRGDEELGGILVRAFFHTLGEVKPLPDAIIFFNSGVKLVVEGSPVVEDLQALKTRGIEILACGTCLGHFELKDKVAVGEVSNMYTIAETLLGAGKVVSL
jgi:selenium metabolism protein YedF